MPTTIPFHSISSERKFFRSVFLLVYHQNPLVLKEIEHWKNKKRKRKSIKKRKEKEKLQESLQIKKGSQFFERRKAFQLQNLFMWVHFLPLHHTISKSLSKIGWESFIALFGPSFNLVICMTWVVSFVFTHEQHLFSF
jgi:hypothetical protein